MTKENLSDHPIWDAWVKVLDQEGFLKVPYSYALNLKEADKAERILRDLNKEDLRILMTGENGFDDVLWRNDLGKVYQKIGLY